MQESRVHKTELDLGHTWSKKKTFAVISSTTHHFLQSVCFHQNGRRLFSPAG